MIAKRSQISKEIDLTPPKALTAELQANVNLIRELLTSLTATAEAEGNSPISEAVVSFALEAKRFEQRAIGALPFEREVG